MLLISLPVQASTLDRVVDDRFICLDATTKFEKKYEIKEHLLSTISNIESGQWDSTLQVRTAWPWTINAQGKGMYFQTKEEAVEKVKELQAKGVKSIDVGCMQVNMVFHGDAFENIEDAFDPYKNVEYAAKFLKRLYNKTDDDWMKAASHYHSKQPKKALAYKRKVLKNYESVKLSLNSGVFDDLVSYPEKKTKKQKDNRKKIFGIFVLKTSKHM